MAPSKPDFKSLIFLPDQVAAVGQDYLRQRRELANSGQIVGVPFGIPKVDANFLPLLPGQLCTIQSRPGNGKTALAVRWARWWAQVVQKNPGQFHDQFVGLVSTEQSVEDLNAFMAAAGTGIPINQMARGQLTDENWSKIELWTHERGTLPLILLGKSQSRRATRTPLRIDLIQEAFYYLEDQLKMRCNLVVLDWLQQLHPLRRVEYRAESKTIEVGENLRACKEVAEDMGCPWVVTLQSRREVDRRDVPIPGGDDGQWASEIEQVSDAMFSAVRPRKYKQEGEMFGDWVVSGHNQLLLTLIKQKMAEANLFYMLSLDPALNKLEEMDEKEVKLNEDLKRKDGKRGAKQPHPQRNSGGLAQLGLPASDPGR